MRTTDRVVRATDGVYVYNWASNAHNLQSRAYNGDR